ncbi:hypothetical protein [Hymenobacter koreensis]
MSTARRRRPAVSHFAYRPLLRRAGILLAVSFGLSFALMAYLFGFDGSFFGRLVGSVLVLFTLLSVTFLLVVPFVNWAADHWFGRTWAEAPTPQPARRPRATNTPKPARYAPRTPAND